MILLDYQMLVARRRELRLTLREVGAASRMPWQRIVRLEDGGDSASLTLDDLGRLADALGLDPLELLKREDEKLDGSPLSARIGAIVAWTIARTARRVPVWLVAQHLGETAQAIRSDIAAVNPALAPVGLRTMEREDGLALEPVGRARAVCLSERDMDRVADGNYAMTTTEAEVLWGVMRWKVARSSEMRRAERVALNHLTAIGVVREPRGNEWAYTLSAEAGEGLLVEPGADTG